MNGLEVALILLGAVFFGTLAAITIVSNMKAPEAGELDPEQRRQVYLFATARRTAEATS